MTNDEEPDRASKASKRYSSRSATVEDLLKHLESRILVFETSRMFYNDFIRVGFETRNVDMMICEIADEGVDLLRCGDLDGAVQVFEGMELVCKGIKHFKGLEFAFDMEWLIHSSRNNLDAAFAALKREEEIIRDFGDNEDLEAVRYAQDRILSYKADDDKTVVDTLSKMLGEIDWWKPGCRVITKDKDLWKKKNSQDD